MYLNGVEAASHGATGTIATNGPLMIVGDKATSASLRYQGGMDDVRFYNRPLTESEITYMVGSQPTPTVAPQRPTSSKTPTATRTKTPTKTATSTAGASPTATPTLLPGNANLPWGTGNDGPLSVATNTTFTLSTDTTGYHGRTCADGISYPVTQVYGDTAVLSQNPNGGCLMLNDEVILINLQGVMGGSSNTGRYEFLRVKGVSGNKVIFNRLKTYFYGSGSYNDNGIGTSAGYQKVVLQRVPNYTTVTINGTLTSNPWVFNAGGSGLLALRASGTITSGSSSFISMDGRGFEGGEGGPVNTDDDGLPGTGYAIDPNGKQPGTSDIYGGGNGGAGGNPQTVHVGGGGGYGGVGLADDGITVSGLPYGHESLERLYLGAGGGGSGQSTSNGTPHPGNNGGSGGGIIFLAASTTNLSGTIRSLGAGGGGGGAGGSIRIHVNTATSLGSLLANGASSYGGVGRIAIYVSGGTLTNPPYSSPAYQLYNQSTFMTPTVTPQPTAIDLSDVYGSGADGGLYVGSGTTFNISTSGKNHDNGCIDGGDAVSYRVISLAAASATLHSAISAHCLNPGDEVLLINLGGTSSKYANTGNYEFLHVGSVDYAKRIVYFNAAKTKYYGEDANADTNIGFSSGQIVALVRVPNYNNVTIENGGTLTTSAFEPPTTSSAKGMGGIIAFRVAGTLQGEGTIIARYLGYRGGGALSGGSCGESNRAIASNAGGGCSGGAGGYGTAGQNGPGTGGTTYGTTDLQDKIYFGAGGGGGASYGGARGGGIVHILAQTIQKKTGDTYAPSIWVQGQNGSATAGGSGAGGSLFLRGRSVQVGSLLIGGGTGGTAAGGDGRSAVYYDTSFSSYNSPNYQEDFTPATATVTPTPTSGASPTPTQTPTVSQATLVSYSYNSYHPHAVTSLSNGSVYTYDANGNMKTRTVNGVTTTFVYDGNNRITSANNASTSEIYVYDGDGNRVVKLVGLTLTAYFAGGSYEVIANSSGTVTSTTKYYSLGGATAMDDNTTLRYLLTDQQGSTVSVLNDTGSAVSNQRYYAFGGIRPDLSGTNNQTDFGYTGQRNMSSIGLMDYNARFYDPALGRFIQPDSVVSNPSNSQTWNRYSYVENSPINRIDPTGHESDTWGCNGDHNCYQQNTGNWSYEPSKPEVTCDPKDIICLLGHKRKDNDPLGLGMAADAYMQGWAYAGTAGDMWLASLRTGNWVQGMAASAYLGVWIGAHIALVAGASMLAYAGIAYVIRAAVGCIAALDPCRQRAIQIGNTAIESVTNTEKIKSQLMSKYDILGIKPSGNMGSLSNPVVQNALARLNNISSSATSRIWAGRWIAKDPIDVYEYIEGGIGVVRSQSTGALISVVSRVGADLDKLNNLVNNGAGTWIR